MKIGLISDSTSYPNLPIMKISAHHKAKGDTVKLVNFELEQFDICYVSKVFTFTAAPQLPKADKYFFGGTGYAIEVKAGKEYYNTDKNNILPPEIESAYPNYGLYNISDIAYGFLTRGCPNNCGFCVVSKKEGCISHKVADIGNFWSGQKFIELMDPNVLACAEREKLLIELANTKAYINYTQGLDARLVDNDIAQLICKTKIKAVHFAFDLIKNESAIINGLKTFKKYRDDFHDRVYILTNYNSTPEEDYYRVRKIKELGYTPYIMTYQKGTQSQFLTDLARWCNNMFLHRSTDFEEYIPRKGGKKAKELYQGVL